MAEAALTLLGKVSLAYPDAMTKVWLASDLFQSKLRGLITDEESKLPFEKHSSSRVNLACKFVSEWISKYKLNQQADDEDES